MDEEGALQVNARLSIPAHEFRFAATRSGGPGGQHVNTSSTRVELWWDVAASPSLTETQRARLIERLTTRLDRQGRLRVVSSAHRSQRQNRTAALERLRELVAAALVVPKIRRPTAPSRAAREARLHDKRRQSAIKRERRRKDDE